MKIINILFLFLFLYSNIFSQTKSIRHKVFFEKNKFYLSEIEESNIDSFIETIEDKKIIKVFLFGNTDNDADSLFNKKLSENRTKTVKEFIIELGIDKSIIKENSFGEDKPIGNNLNDNGKKVNRRVDITILYEENLSQVDVEIKNLPEIDSCKRDTTITMKDGTQVIFNLFEYQDFEGCIDIQTANNPNDLLVNGISLSDTTGSPIASCGMINLRINPNCNNNKCFKYPVNVRFPVPEENDCNFCGRNSRVWVVGSGGRWSQNQRNNRRIKRITINGKKYYQLKLLCPNKWMNCDCKTKYNKVKIKAKREFIIANLKVLYNCPTALYEYHSNNNKIKANLPCFYGNKTITGTFINKTGDTFVLPLTNLDSLPKRILFSKCKKNKNEIAGKWLGIFPLAKREIYRKYIIPENLLLKKEKI